MTRSGAARRAAAARAGKAGLLGSYPVPALHLVGAPVPVNPRSPSHWQPAAPPPQYGLDYSFLSGRRGEPAGWAPGEPVTVRIAGPHTPAQLCVLAAATRELAGLTGLTLRPGEPWPEPLAPVRVPDGEIHAGFRPPPRGRQTAGSGGAALGPAGHYVSGYAIVYLTAVGQEAADREPDPHELADPVLAVLRHELAHALGLGHAARLSLLMHHQIAVGIRDYGRGDRHGLALLGHAPPARDDTLARYRRRSLTCGA